MNANKFVKKYTMVLALLVVFVFFTYLTGGRLLLAQNISNLLLQNAYVLIMACGMLLCILTGGNVDLSVGSTLCLSAALSAKMLSMGINPLIAILSSVTVACIIGVWQGWLIGYIHIPPFICTLAGMFLFRGIARVILDSKTVAVMDKKFLSLFTSYIQIPGLDVNQRVISSMAVGILVAIVITAYTFISERNKMKKGYESASINATAIKVAIFDLVILFYAYKLMSYKGIPIMLIWILVVVAIFAFITSSTVFGRYFYAVGGNEKATRLSGIDPRKVYFWAYFLMSLLAGLSGLLVGARIGSVDGNMGNSYEMDAIASCFIGGASAYGGSGTVQGIMIGAILLGVINQGMSILGLPDQFQYIVKGAVLLGAVVFDVVSNHKTGKS
ncbi:sugar ABC transporter permease [Lachnoanaerobaculum saburreum]|uniref:Xylose transport system permease protein XylH n=1 Tax=Lachnoanaerobaculum saburreum DSM 3986 TaxID=887325 RepID=E6LP08_9FIRM|nr:sugar ABC transporter permease [Lachnoanaerobaculum saburreum]EFU76429.1 branched-chain amino acid ABC transporter, permease protein [Lachnoanaerobaculum saburreum DSM 3986]